MEESNNLLEMESVTKIFPGVRALDNVSFNLRKGEVHALLGENGAGKSTLIKVLGGIYKPDEGKLIVNGNQVNIESVEDAHNTGISIIHQELVLVPHMTVYENIFLGKEEVKNGLIQKQKMIEETQRMLDSFNLDFKPTTLVTDLSIASQQMVEIIKALSYDAKIIVMDEPTSSISDTEVEQLFKIINQLKKQGVGIIYISHKMSELDEICDRVTILRDGQYISTHVVKETSRDVLIAEMVGRQIDNFYVREDVEKGDVVLEAKGISGLGFEDVNFHIKEGEIIGFAGLIGSGRSEVMKSIYGLDPITDGKIFFKGEETNISNPRIASSKGISLVPENRKEEALFLDKDVRYNASLGILNRIIKGVRVDDKSERNIVEGYINTLNIKTPSQTHLIRNLSGGNQQKVVITRWLATNPNVLILDEPTRGIDIGAKTEIYTLMNELTKKGMSIIMVSSELPEVINMSDRVYVMSAGTVVGEVSGDDMTQEKIMQFATKNM